MTHDEQFGIAFLHRLAVELQRSLVEPARPWFLVVMERKPCVSELPDLRVVLTPPKIDDVGYAEGA